MSTVAFLICGGLGWYGAIKAYQYQIEGTRQPFIFTPVGGWIYALVSGLTFIIYLKLAAQNGDPYALISLLIIIPILVFPFGAWFVGVLIGMGTSFFSPNHSVSPLRSFDKGDAAMARRDFKAAAALFREDLERWPGDTQAIMRLTRALEADGQPQEAADLLDGEWQQALQTPSGGDAGLTRPSTAGPEAQRRERNERIMVLTYALGDLYVGVLQRPQEARVLYEKTLEHLYGFPGADPLRQRLKNLGA